MSGAKDVGDNESLLEAMECLGTLNQGMHALYCRPESKIIITVLENPVDERPVHHCVRPPVPITQPGSLDRAAPGRYFTRTERGLYILNHICVGYGQG